jgi:predicted metalloprotease
VFVQQEGAMRWEGRRQSENVEDRRGVPAGRAIAGGGAGIALLALLVFLLGGDPGTVLENVPGSGPPAAQGEYRASAEEEKLKEFVSVVLADTEDVWREEFRRQGRSYREPTLVLFTGRVESACGFASAAVGPFYCGADEKVYIDLAFYDELKRRFGAPGDFAQAYVIAHEVGHHVQNQLGILERVHSRRRRMSETAANDLSVRLELQADFLAGMWARQAHAAKNILDRSDIDEALRAAAAIGDDRMQMQAQGYVVPESFTHGSSEQRIRWFRRGWESGNLRDGDTFNASRL